MGWQKRNGSRYVPTQRESNNLSGQRIDDEMFVFISDPLARPTPRDMLDVDDIYAYDTLPVP
jgi:hypothetical protein